MSDPGAELPNARAYHTVTQVAGKLFLYGGGSLWSQWAESPRTTWSDLWRFDIPERKWTKLEPSGEAPPGLEGHSCFDWNDKMYIFGGFDGLVNYCELYCYDPETNEWSAAEQRGDVPEARVYHSSARVGDQVFIISGSSWEDYTGSIYEDMFCLDLKSLTWTQIALPPQQQNNANGEEDYVASYPCGRFAHSCVPLGSNQLFVFGGWRFVWLPPPAHTSFLWNRI